MPEKQKKIKFFIFSDESGSWHDISDVYVRSWVVIPEDEYAKLLNKVDEISHLVDAAEVSWNLIANNSQFLSSFTNLNYRIFITISSPKDINWETKYAITQNFYTSIEKFDFGAISEELKKYIKDRIFRDIKNALFLHYYEKFHIKNAKKGIEKIIKPSEFELIYRIDPPQMSQTGWKEILNSISEKEVDTEFPKSSKTQGIQFADVVAGCVRSLLVNDRNYDKACILMNQIKSKLIPKDKVNPNPNLIFYGEMNSDLIAKCSAIWNL